MGLAFLMWTTLNYMSKFWDIAYHFRTFVS